MKNIKKVLLFGLSTLTVGLTLTGVFSSKEDVPVFAANYTNESTETYYADVARNLKGNDLVNKLHEIDSSKHRKTILYDYLFGYFPQTDPAPGDKITSFYSGNASRSNAMNREHVWPDSHGGNLVENDLHMVRPTIKSENSSRGNSFYVEGMETEYDGWDPAVFNNESYRGDAARIIFYCCIANTTLELLDVNKHHTTSENNDYRMGKLSDLLKWNLKYPVSDRERVRNREVEKIQGNKNPFIDNPSYACRVWGNTNSTTKQICGYDKVSDFHLDLNNRSVGIGKSIRLSYTLEPVELEEKCEITWTSSDETVATVDSGGLIKTLKEGETTITAKIGLYNVSDTCFLTVVNEPSSTPSGGCGGNLYTTSIILSSISAIGIGLILLSAFKKKEEK